MEESVSVTIPVDQDVAAILAEPGKRELASQLLNRVFRPTTVAQLFDAIDRLKADAHARGLTDEIVDQELAAYNAERRERAPTGV